MPCQRRSFVGQYPFNSLRKPVNKRKKYRHPDRNKRCVERRKACGAGIKTQMALRQTNPPQKKRKQNHGDEARGQVKGDMCKSSAFGRNAAADGRPPT
jgi:hypothetical protein